MWEQCNIVSGCVDEWNVVLVRNVLSTGDAIWLIKRRGFRFACALSIRIDIKLRSRILLMKGYVNTQQDKNGVHINSGILDKAFYLAATWDGDNAWQTAGKMWFVAMIIEKFKLTFNEFVVSMRPRNLWTVTLHQS